MALHRKPVDRAGLPVESRACGCAGKWAAAASSAGTSQTLAYLSSADSASGSGQA